MSIDKTILSFLKKYSYDVKVIDRLITSAFIKKNFLAKIENVLISELLIKETDGTEHKALEDFCNLFEETKQTFDFECLIELFEFVISPNDKVVNGAVYTPKYIREYIVSNAVGMSTQIQDRTACDVACGCGGFLYEYTLLLHQLTNKPITDIIENNLYGIDITEYSINRTKILLTLLAISNGEDKAEIRYNFFKGDSLQFDWFSNSSKIKDNLGFDYIFSNPPYVGSSNLDNETKKLMANWTVSSTGKLDLYIPFFELGLKWLREDGVLGYITVSNFYRSLNGRALRKYFSDNTFLFKLIDFGGSQVFNSRLTYTCICLIEKTKGNIRYTSSAPSKINKLNESDFIPLEYEKLNDFDGWHLDDVKTQLNISRMENIGEKLGDLFNIRNGFATLRNKIYLFTPDKEDDRYYYFERNGNLFKIEKAVCKDAIKPNILKTESDINKFREKLIFPYRYLNRDNTTLFEQKTNKFIEVIKENLFKEQYPFTYRYLKEEKNELAKRDRGNREYETWFAFGRSQALFIPGKKLLFPYISDKPYFVFTDEEDLLFYNGYALVSESESDLLFIQKILKSRLFWYYIKHTSKPYANNYFALAKNYVKNFSIPNFTLAEKRKVISYKNLKSLESFLLKKYNITDIELEDY